MLFQLLIAGVGLSIVTGYPGGAPQASCTTGVPLHTSTHGDLYPPQAGRPPFKIICNTTTIRPGDSVNVQLRSESGEKFKGLFLRVKAATDAEGTQENIFPEGSFIGATANTKVVRCDHSFDILTHKDAFSKESVEFAWRSPLYFKYDIRIEATVVSNFSVFWKNITSPRIQLELPERFPAEELERPWLTEVANAVYARSDHVVARNLTHNRFSRGFSGLLDPNGFLLTQYVLDVLPFEDSPNRGANNTVVDIQELLNEIQMVEEEKASMAGQNVTKSMNSTEASSAIWRELQQEYIKALLADNTDAAAEFERVINMVYL